MDRVRRDGRSRVSAEEAGDGTDGEGSSESESDDGSDRESAGENVSDVRRFCGSKSSLYNHLLASPDCCNSYSDSSFTVLFRGRHGYGLQLKVLEATVNFANNDIRRASEKCPYSRSVLITEVPFECM